VAFLIKRHSHISNSSKKYTAIILTSLVYLFTILAITVFVYAGFKPDQIKAAYIYNLPNFVHWPKLNREAKKKAFVINVLGNHLIAHYLKILTKGEDIKGLPIKVNLIESASKVSECDILFVDKSFEAQLDIKQLQNLAQKGTLTVGESVNFLSKGGMIGLVPEGKRIVIVINTLVADQVKITFSSKLMRVARIFKDNSLVEK